MAAEEYVSTRACGEVSSRILAKLDSIERRLFKDNGTLSIQTRLDRHEQVIRVILWALSIVGGAILTYLVVAVVVLLKAVLRG